MKYLTILLILGIFISCKNTTEYPKELYTSKSFKIYNDSVVQGKNIAKVISSNRIVSNYNSPINENYSNIIAFKFSINEKDNDISVGKDRLIQITNQSESKTFEFGQAGDETIITKPSILPVNYEFTFKVDMNPVFKEFKGKGYYLASNGSKIAKTDFKNVYIAGGSLPLTWDFSNLDERGLKMQDKNGDGIYEIKLILNPAIKKKDKVWQLSKDISNKPTYKSEQPLVDALYNLSLEEAKLAIEPDSTFRTGAKWAGVWTRDISYSIVLAFAYLEPKVAIKSLLRKVKRDRIIQDTGSGGSWPVSSDRMIWSLAAWEVYKTTGDKNWLKRVYQIIKNSEEDDYKVIHSETTGMYLGESSFLDWREQTYPKWMSNKDIYVSQNLGTNIVHYQTHIILSKIAKILGESSKKYDDIASEIKKGINERLWMEDKGYFAQYLYGRHFLIPSKRFEALGEALAVLFDVADEKQSNSIVEKSPLTEYGVTCIYPQIPEIPPYHNNAIWPFVQSYWNLAAAKVGNEKVLNYGLASLYRASGLFLTNYENMVAQTGDYKGTEINSNRMLWSMAGNLSMVYRVLMGIQFEENQLLFHPVIPEAYGGNRSLKNFNYREANLDIQITGYGNKISDFKLDGNRLNKPIIPATLKGKHTIKITMQNNNFSDGEINLVNNKFSLSTPDVKRIDNNLTWNPVEGAMSYNVYENGKVIQSTELTSFPINNHQFNEYMVSAIDVNNFESFVSEPIIISDKANMKYELEDYVPKSNLGYVNYSGNGYIELSTHKNRKLSVSIQIPENGEYYLDFKYSNGSGPWNTDNKCTTRSLYLNKNYIGAIVFPQRGSDEWSDWGYSNSYKVHLNKGKNELDLFLENWNTNMNIDVNRAMVDFLRIYKINNINN